MADAQVSVGSWTNFSAYDTAERGPFQVIGEGTTGHVPYIADGIGNVRFGLPGMGGGTGVGDVSRNGTTHDHRIVRWDGTNPNVEDSVVTIDDSGNVSGYGTLQGGASNIQLTTANGYLRLAAIDTTGGVNGDVIQMVGGVPTWETISGAGLIGGSGTTNRITKFTSGTAIGDSQLFDDGTTVQIGTTTAIDASKILQISSNTGTLAAQGALYIASNSRFGFDLAFYKSRGVLGTPAVVQYDPSELLTDSLGGIGFFGYAADGSWQAAASIGSEVDFTPSGSVLSGGLHFHTVDTSGVHHDRLYIHGSETRGGLIVNPDADTYSFHVNTTTTDAFIVNATTNVARFNIALTLSTALAMTSGGTGLATVSANRVLYATASNTWGTSASFTYDGTTLVLGSAPLISGSSSAIGFQQTSASVDQKLWTIYANSDGTFSINAVSDSLATNNVGFKIGRSGATITSVIIGSNSVPITATTGDIWYASASNTIIARAIGSTGQVLTVAGGIPTWATPGTVTFNSISPMTTLGDTIYGAAAGSGTRLAGNTTTTRKFLRQTGDGTNSAAPAWDTVTKTDVGLSAVENTALSTWAGTTNITTLGTIVSGTWNAGIIALAYGGTAANLTASNGGIFYSTASAGAILAGTATAGQMLRSGASAAPAWSTNTFPNTTSVNQILFATSVNVIGSSSSFAWDGTTLTLTSSGGSGGPSLSGASVQIAFKDTGSTANNQICAWMTNSDGTLRLRIYNDTLLSSADIVTFTRSGATVGTTTFSGAVTISGVGIIGSTTYPGTYTASQIPYISATNTISQSSNFLYNGADMCLGTTNYSHAANYATLNVGGSTGGQITLQNGTTVKAYWYNDATNITFGAIAALIFAHGGGATEHARFDTSGDFIQKFGKQHTQFSSPTSKTISATSIAISVTDFYVSISATGTLATITGGTTNQHVRVRCAAGTIITVSNGTGANQIATKTRTTYVLMDAGVGIVAQYMELAFNGTYWEQIF